jgi:hypothetical protein
MLVGLDQYLNTVIGCRHAIDGALVLTNLSHAGCRIMEAGQGVVAMVLYGPDRPRTCTQHAG